MKTTQKKEKRVSIETQSEKSGNRTHLFQTPFRRGIIPLPYNISETWPTINPAGNYNTQFHGTLSQPYSGISQQSAMINSNGSMFPFAYLPQANSYSHQGINNAIKTNPGNPFLYGPQQIFPAINILEADTEFLIELALPGFYSENCKVKIKDNVLWVYGRIENEKEIGLYSIQEIGNWYFERVFALPENIETSSTEASFENGILYITLPKTEENERTERDILISEEVFEN